MSIERRSKELYNSFLIDPYIRLINKRYPHVDINEALAAAAIMPWEAADESHWLTQEQINKFTDQAIKLTGNPDLPREAGQYVFNPESTGFMRSYVLSFTNPHTMFDKIGEVTKQLVRSSTYTSRKLNDTSVEIIVNPFHDTKEESFQCENRKGLFEATVKAFHYELLSIEHPECMFDGGHQRRDGCVGAGMPCRRVPRRGGADLRAPPNAEGHGGAGDAAFLGRREQPRQCGAARQREVGRTERGQHQRLAPAQGAVARMSRQRGLQDPQGVEGMAEIHQCVGERRGNSGSLPACGGDCRIRSAFLRGGAQARGSRGRVGLQQALHVARHGGYARMAGMGALRRCQCGACGNAIAQPGFGTGFGKRQAEVHLHPILAALQRRAVQAYGARGLARAPGSQRRRGQRIAGRRGFAQGIEARQRRTILAGPGQHDEQVGQGLAVAGAGGQRGLKQPAALLQPALPRRGNAARAQGRRVLRMRLHARHQRQHEDRRDVSQPRHPPSCRGFDQDGASPWRCASHSRGRLILRAQCLTVGYGAARAAACRIGTAAGTTWAAWRGSCVAPCRVIHAGGPAPHRAAMAGRVVQRSGGRGHAGHNGAAARGQHARAMTWQRAARLGLGLAVGCLGGAAFAWLKLPLPWLIGALVTVAAARLLGVPAEGATRLRNAFLGVIGIVLGAYFTPATAALLLAKAPLLLIAALMTLAVGGALAPLLVRRGKVDIATAWFASIPGGVADMAMLAESYGGRPAPVALAQLLRVCAVVIIVPNLFALAGMRGDVPVASAVLPLMPARLILLFLAGLAGGGAPGAHRRAGGLDAGPAGGDGGADRFGRAAVRCAGLAGRARAGRARA